MTTTTVPEPQRLRDRVAREAGARQARLGADPRAAAEMARLREAARRAPGTDARVLPFVFAAVPEHLSFDGPVLGRHEVAAFHALTLHAILSQSGGPGHVPGSGFGEAVHRLGRERSSAASIERRFQMVLTAGTTRELAAHLRSMATMLRGARIGLDIGRLAEDIASWTSTEARSRTRLRWAREHARAGRQAEKTDNQTDTDQNTNQEQS